MYGFKRRWKSTVDACSVWALTVMCVEVKKQAE
jgi:hypothetical protein